jgi:hypothetical protein
MLLLEMIILILAEIILKERSKNSAYPKRNTCKGNKYYNAVQHLPEQSHPEFVRSGQRQMISHTPVIPGY